MQPKSEVTFGEGSPSRLEVLFVNTKKCAETLHNMMRKEDIKSTIVFGDMDWAERYEMIAKFKSEEISVIITTNMLARGMDFPQV